MQLKEIMTRHVECLKPTDTLVHAAEKMRDLNVGSLPICDADRLTGIITDRDITVRGTASGCDPETTRVADIMTPEISFCFEDDTIDEAVNLMEEKQIRRVAVLNRAKRLVRELFRHNKPGAAMDIVIVPRKEMLDASYERIEAEFRSLLSKPARSKAANA